MKPVLLIVLMVAACGGADEAVPIDAAVDGAVIDTPAVDATDAALLDADLRCGACTPSQVCVQYFNGTCGDGHVECQERGAGCTGNACTPDCQFWHCGAADAGTVYQCGVASCPDDLPVALRCYGP